MRKIFMSVCCLSAMALVSCGGSNKSEEKVMHSVMLTHPVMSMSAFEKSFPGVVKESQEINLGFKTAGQIEKIHVKEGSYVKEGQLIAELDSKDYQLGVNATQIQYDQLSRQVERLKKLKEGRSISGNDYDKAVSGLEQLAIQLQADKNKVAYTKLYAPTSGYVQKVNFDKAEMVNAGTPVVVLLDTHNMEVEVNIPAEIYTQQKNIASIVCKSNMIEKEMPMKLVSITPKADANQLYQMILSFKGAVDKKITSGMNVDVNFMVNKTTQEKSRQTLPLHAIFHQEDSDYIWVLRSDSTVAKMAVTVNGVDDRGNAVIETPLTGNEKVIKAGVNMLQEGEKVKVIDQNSDTNVGGLL